ncbi:hypothetical protein [Cognatiluteimonas profundi]|uniref:hypothetical protein n=1 Tax=Cognatiluteimonas profundi TaxID=2594501 RepID=UPI00131AF1EE|nr:hypothetical protein [Lysobacter profundi]
MSATIYHHRFAGLRLVSDLHLPELPRAAPDAWADFRITIAPTPVFPAMASVDWQHDFTDNDGAHAFRCVRVGGEYGFDFPGVAQAWVTPDNGIALWQRHDSTMESVRHVLLDQVLPRLLAQRGHMVLHGAAVHTQDDCTLLMIGDSGMGKSTLAAAFGRAGADVLSDDGVLIAFDAASIHAVPCYAGLRLWPDSLGSVLADRVADSTAMAHYNDKRRLLQPGPTRASYPIDAIVLLQPSIDASTIAIQSCATQAACIALVGNAFQLDLGDHGNLVALLARAADVVQRVPVLSLAYPRDYTALPRVMERLLSELHQVARAHDNVACIARR